TGLLRRRGRGMSRFGSGMSVERTAGDAAREAVRRARASFDERAHGARGEPKLAIVFASVSYPDADAIPRVLAEELGDTPVIGGTSGACLVGPEGVAGRG